MKVKIVFAIGMFTLAWIIPNAIFVCFVHHDSQNKVLSPKDYDIQILTASDYEKVISPEKTSITTFDGSIISKSDQWNMEDKYKSIQNGSQYVLITTKGTAHLIDFWLSTIIPVISFLILLTIIALWPQAKTASHSK